MTESAVLYKEYAIEQGNFIKAGEASSAIKQDTRHLGVDSGVMRRVSIAAYEAEPEHISTATAGRSGRPYPRGTYSLRLKTPALG